MPIVKTLTHNQKLYGILYKCAHVSKLAKSKDATFDRGGSRSWQGEGHKQAKL